MDIREFDKSSASLERFGKKNLGLFDRFATRFKTIRSQLGPRGDQPFVPLAKRSRCRRNPSQE